MEQTPITKRGSELLHNELKELTTVRRPAISHAIGVAREHGDLKENSEYHAAREEQSFVEARIRYIEGVLGSCIILDVEKLAKEQDLDTVIFGSKVHLYNLSNDTEITYRIVGADESDIKKGRISYQTPIARGLIGKAIGEIATINTPNGVVEFEILDIVYDNEPLDAA